METLKTSFLRMWPIFKFGLVLQEEITFKKNTYLELWQPALCYRETTATGQNLFLHNLPSLLAL